jgi:hypothetical protein
MQGAQIFISTWEFTDWLDTYSRSSRYLLITLKRLNECNTIDLMMWMRAFRLHGRSLLGLYLRSTYRTPIALSRDPCCHSRWNVFLFVVTMLCSSHSLNFSHIPINTRSSIYIERYIILSIRLCRR